MIFKKKIFKKATLAICGAKYTTISYIILFYNILIDILEDFIDGENDATLVSAAKVCISKLLKYYRKVDSSPIYTISIRKTQ